MLQVDGLTKYFGSLCAVDGLSFELEEGCVCGFIGPNGAGKTTTMRIISTLEEPTEGEILLEGISIFDDPYRLRKTVGFMPDHYGSYPSLQVRDYLEFYARAYDLHGAEREKRLNQIMDFTGLDAISDKAVETLSKGMRQRLNLGRALVNDPKLMILDEPAAGLDPRARIELRYLVKSLADAGKTIFISSHILTELSEMCDYLLIIDKGRRISFGSFEDIQKELQDTVEIHVRLVDEGQAEGLERFLLERRNVDEVRVRENGLVTFGFLEENAHVPELLREMMNKGFSVMEFRPEALSMEEVFMQITSDNAGNGDGGNGKD